VLMQNFHEPHGHVRLVGTHSISMSDSSLIRTGKWQSGQFVVHDNRHNFTNLLM